MLYLLGDLHAATSAHLATVHPSQQWMADELRCHLNTAHRQVAALKAAGVVAVYVNPPRKRGDGTYTRATNRMRPDVAACQRVIAGKGPGGAYTPSTVPMSPLRGAENHGAVPSSTPPPPNGAEPAPERGPPCPAPEQLQPFDGPTAEGRAIIASIHAARAERRATGLAGRAPNAGRLRRGW
jgi:hypothetical protein